MFDVRFKIKKYAYYKMQIFQGTPQVTEKTIDSQKAVDTKIKEKCEEFISYTFDYITSDIKNFVIYIKSPLEKEEVSGLDHGKNENVEDCKLKLKETLQAFQNKRATVQKSMSLYLSNPETETIVFKQIKVCFFNFLLILYCLILTFFIRPKFKCFTNNW